MINSFNNFLLLFLHFQLLFHPQQLKFPQSFPFVKQIHIPSPTPSVTPMSSPTPEITVSLSPTLSPTLTVSPSHSNTPTPTVTIIPTEVPTFTPSLTPSPTLSPTSVPSSTPSENPSPTLTPSPTIEISPVPTENPPESPTPTTAISVSPTPDLSPILTITNTPTPTPIIGVSITPTPTIMPSLSPTPTLSLTPTPSPEPVGNDISYPQCGKEYPVGQMFGIVGVNGGIASTTNPCLSSQLSWAAATSNFNINQPKVQLYVNTGNPGGLNTATWPRNNVDPEGNGTSNPYGNCDGSNSIACAWQYGWNRALEDVNTRFIPAANSAGISAIPANYVWWLDVETTNSWRDGSAEALQANAAVLEGMVAYFKSKGINPGIYSTGYQWGVIVGTLSPQSSLNGLPNWIPGASDLIGAKAKCQTSPFTSGSSVILTQFTMNNFDYDYSCIN